MMENAVVSDEEALQVAAALRASMMQEEDLELELVQQQESALEEQLAQKQDADDGQVRHTHTHTHTHTPDKTISSRLAR